MSRTPKPGPATPPTKRRLTPGRLLVAFLNTGLALALALQVTLLIWLLPNGEITIPQPLLDRAHQQLAQHDIRLSTTDIEIDLRGYLTLHRPALSFLSTGETAFEADSILIGFRPWALLLGKISLDDLRIINGTLYCPAVISPTGTREPVSQNLFLNARSIGHWWNIDRLNLDLAGVRIALAGPLPQTIIDSPDTPPAPTPAPDIQHIRSLYERTCRTLIETQEQLKPLSHPIILAQLDRESAAGAGIALYAQFTRSTDLHGITLGETFLTARLNLGRDRILRAETPATLVSYDLHYLDKFQSPRIELKVTPANGPKGILDVPTRALLFTDRPAALGLSFDGAMILADYHGMENIRVHVGLKSLEDWLSIHGTLNATATTATLHLQSHWDPAFFLKATPFAEMGALPPVHFATRPLFRAEITLTEGWQFAQTWMELESGPASYDTLHLEALYTQAKLRPGHIHLYHTALHTADYTVTGSYWQDIETNDYRFLLEGQLRPTDISFIIDEDWWDELWADFTFPHQLPHASIDLRGRYYSGDTNRFMYCRAQLPTATYRGVAVDSATAWVFQLPTVLDIIDLNVHAGPHAARADIQFLYSPGQENRLSLGFTGTSNLPLDSLAGLIGPEATPYQSLFTTQTPPALRAAGMVYGKDSPHADELTLKIQAHFPAQTLFQEITFDHIAFNGLVQPHQVTMTDIQAGLAAGTLTGQATLDTPDDGSPYDLHLDLDLQNATLLGLFTHIPPLARVKTEAEEKARQEAAKLDPEEQRYAGILDITYLGQGNPDRWQTFHGTGKAYLRDAHLGQLHLFGGLSRLIRNLGLNFGTIDFTSARTSYTLDHGSLLLPDTRILGETSSIDANGIYDIDNDTLNFALSLHPLGAIETPVVSQVLGLLSPIANTVEVQLTGSLSDPQWNTTFGLLRAITGPRTITE